MPESWKYPVAQPLFTDSLAKEIVEHNAKKGKKPKAFDTRLRFSDAGKCARQTGYSVLGLQTELDAASQHVAWVGTLYHKHWSRALRRRYPGARVEVSSQLEEISDSGHADGIFGVTILRAVIEWDGGRVSYELKTKGTYQFDKALGIMRKQWKSKGEPKGPGLEVILQAAMNARANDCGTVVIGYVCFENFSVGAAARMGLRQMDRFLAEWHLPKNVWEPLLDDEIERLHYILDTVDGGQLPERLVYDDDGFQMVIDPEANKPFWMCDGYCSKRQQCIEDGPGEPRIPVELGGAR